MTKRSAKKGQPEPDAPVVPRLVTPKPLGAGPRSREARSRGHFIDHLSVPDIDRPGWGRKRGGRYTDSDLVGEERVDLLRRIRDCALSGMNDFEIEEALGITHQSLRRWAFDDPAVASCLEIPADIALSRVERALYHKATGYSFRSEEIKVINDEVVRVQTIKHVPPNETAAIFYLKNRAPDRWADVTKVDVDGTIDTGQTEVDPRKLAMAMLAVLQDGVTASVTTIEHVPEQNDDDQEPADAEAVGEQADDSAGQEPAPRQRRQRRSI